MTIRRFIPWTLTHWLVYGGGFAFVTALTAWFVAAPTVEYGLLEKLPALLVPAAWGLGSIRLWQARRAYADRIVGVTANGVSVVAWNPGARDFLLSGSPLGELWREVELVVNGNVAFWKNKGIGGEERLRDYFNGLAVEVVLWDEPLVDRVHGVVARGLTWPKRCVVQVNLMARWPDSIPPGEPLPKWRADAMEQARAQFWALVGHELSHACLDALGFPQAAQHQAMKDAGCPWA